MKDREAAIYSLMDIFERDGYNNIVLRRAFKKNENFTSVQKAFITELVNGTLRNLIFIDYIINIFSKTKTDKMKPLILNALRVSVYQIFFMRKIPVSAVCNEAVEIVKKRGFKGLSGFVNGVLRNISKNIDNIQYPDIEKNFIKYVSVRYSYPERIIEYWLENLSHDEILKMCEKSSESPRITAAVNTVKTNRERLLEVLREDGVLAEKVVDFDGLIEISKTDDISQNKAYKNGLFHIMDKSSYIAVEELSPKENDYIIDVCAAPGGKSFLCAYLMSNKGEIKSRDIYEHKIKLISDGMKRLGLNIIHAEKKDALTVYKDDFKTADKVIVDVPCSGLGIVRKKPDIKYSKSFEDIERLSRIQKNILTVVQNYVKIGGILVYSTCTVSYKENEENVKWFIENFAFELISQKRILPQDFDSDGFFIAKFVRKG